MGRIPDHLVSLAFRALENRWVTIGAKVGKNTKGKKKGGTPVELDGEGKITKGPAALTGKRPSELSQSHLFTGQDHKSQRKLFAEPGDPPPPPPIDETPKAPPAAAKKEPKPRAKKPLSMSLLAVIRREGGISSGDFEHADFKEFGLLGALNKKGLSLDDMAATMVRQGHITVPMGKSSPSDHLLQLLKKKTNSLLAADTAEYDKDYEAYMQAREEAQADGYEEGQLEEVRGRGEEAGGNESKDRLFEEIFGGDGSGGEEAGRDEEPGDLAGDSAEPASGLDTSFDFGPAAAPKVEEKPKAAKPKKAAKQDKPAPAPAPPVIEPQAPAPPPAIEPKPAKKEDHEMTSAEYLRNGRPNFGDMVLTPYGKLGIMSGAGSMGSNRVKVKGVWHDRDDLKLIRRPDKDVNQNLSGEWKAKQKADLAQIDKDHGVILHKKSMVDSAKKRLQAGTMTQDQYDNFVGTGFYKMTDDEVTQAEKAQAEIDAIKNRPLEFEQSVHSLRVANALASGKDVPANVLAEYPDLAKKYGKDKAQPAPATTQPPPPATNLFGQPEPTKPQPATTQGLYGEQVPVEDPKVAPRETVADQAEKGLDWLYQKQDPKTDGTGEMFGGLFSPGRTSGATEPEAGPVAPPAVEPSAPATSPKATSLPDRIKNLNVLLNKTRSSANAKALRTAIAQLEREAGPVEPPKIESASPAAPQAPASAEFDPASPPGVSDKDIPLDLAYNAHRGTSFVPEKRAQARVEEYVNDMKGIWSDLAKMATTPEQQATLKDEFERFRKGYVEKNKAMLSAMSRQVSSMIAGPARFPVDRMRKRANTADNRREEFLEFRKKAIASIQRKLDPSTNGIRQAAPDASAQLNSKATELRKQQEKMKAANNLIRKELKTNRPQNVTPQQSEKLKAGLAAIGLDAREVSSILKPDYMGQIGYQDFMLRNNLANIKRQEQRQAEVQQFQQSAPQSPETEYDGGVTVTEHPEDQRIRIKFPGKPNSEQMRELKARGFKWAPSQKAWSRVLTSNARTAAQSIMKELGLNKVGADTTTESRTLSTIRQQLREAFRQCP
jgi:hypothetical protein